jgi:hypothetical protein
VREDKTQDGATTRLSASLPYYVLSPSLFLCEARQRLDWPSRIQVVPNHDDDDWLEKVEGVDWDWIGVAEKCVGVV